MVDPKDVTPGFWYAAEGPRAEPPWRIVEVGAGGEVYAFGSEESVSVYSGDLEFLSPVPPPPRHVMPTKT